MKTLKVEAVYPMAFDKTAAPPTETRAGSSPVWAEITACNTGAGGSSVTPDVVRGEKSPLPKDAPKKEG